MIPHINQVVKNKILVKLLQKVSQFKMLSKDQFKNNNKQ